MEQPTPITKSLHRICVENPRFHVHPLFWTCKHLQVLHCQFNHLDSTSPSLSLPPSPPLSPSSDTDRDLARLVPRMKNGEFASGRFACFCVMMRPRGIIKAYGRPYFLYNKAKLHMVECNVFKIDEVYNFEQPPIIGHFQYDELVKQRKRANRPRRHPVPGTLNLPAERLYQRRLRDLTPAMWFEDPYLVCILLSLAQFQRQKSQTTPEIFFVRLLVTNVSDTTHAHVFQADIPSELLRAFDNPTEDMDNVIWPAIQHVQVPFEPHASFSERIAGQLLAGLKTRASEDVPRGEKRKRDEMDTEEQTKSVKPWDDAVQVAAVPLLPEFENKPFTLDDSLTDKARNQIADFVSGPQEEDPEISKHYLHKAANTISVNTTTASNQGTSPHKRPRRSIRAAKYTSSVSDDSGPSREGSHVSEEYMEQVAAKDLPSEDSVVLLITRVLNLISYYTQPFGSQPVVDFRTER
ncbi:hypothetical protein FGADI_8557 [Fusarium gaditjirri]|uniref:Uncharacterized protein n=1 Tax=Fusarium gaditjirri TaxID=282569 RepID=A0A8H4T283_9HYPO|nr:hypothetical protein FGADI_8557 [Fusarium gaditjirri]